MEQFKKYFLNIEDIYYLNYSSKIIRIKTKNFFFCSEKSTILFVCFKKYK